MRMKKKNRKRFVILSMALFMICGVALGYAALSSSLKINGTGTISTNWDILFTNITEKSSRGAVNNDSRIMGKLTATFDVDLESPGSYIEYNVTLKNNGNTDAVIAKVTGIVEANNAAPAGIQFKVSGIRIGDDLLAGSEKTFVVRAEIPVNATTLPSGSKVLELKAEVRQKEVDSSGLVTTIGECFETNEAGDTITRYLCGKGNTNGYSEILDVNIPREINGHIITKIGTSAFYSKGLNSVHIENTIIEIGYEAFWGNFLQELSIPASVTTIGSYAFFMNQLRMFQLPNSVTTIGDYAFSRNQLKEIVIPGSVKKLGVAAFHGNNVPLEKAFIYNRNSDGTENRTSINSYAASSCGDLVIPEQVTVIGSNAFSGRKCQSLQLPENIQTIGYGAFNGNEFTELVLPAHLTVLSMGAFENNQLNRVEFKGSTPPKLETNIFKGNPDLTANTIKVPVGSLKQYKNVNHPSYSPSQLWFGTNNESVLDAFYE